MSLNFKKARKKPIDIEVVQLTNSVWDQIFNEDSHKIEINGYILQAALIDEGPLQRKVFYVNTLEDVSEEHLHQAQINDWLMVGVKGEIYACDNSIFEESYEIVN